MNTRTPGPVPESTRSTGAPRDRNPLTDFVHPICPVGKIKKAERPHRFLLGGVAYVLWRDKQGNYHGTEDACPHRRASLSCGHAIDDAIYCPYHRWRISSDGECRSPSDPEMQLSVPRFRVFAELGYLWMSKADAPSHQLLPELPGWKYAGHVRLTMNAPLETVIDNFSENEHLPWVHGGLGWDASGLDSIEFQFEKTDDGAHVIYRGLQRAHILFKMLMIRSGDIFQNDVVHKFEPLHTTYKISWEDPKHGRRRPLATASTVYFVPETRNRTTLHFFIQYHLSGLHFLEPILKRSVRLVTMKEGLDDKRFVERVMADAPIELRGMKLRKFDRPIAHGRKLLAEKYLRGYTIPPETQQA